MGGAETEPCLLGIHEDEKILGDTKQRRYNTAWNY